MGNHAYINVFGQRLTPGLTGSSAAMKRLMPA
jgi:hypothetical protein